MFATVAAWHCARFTFLEYIHDARDWGLLGTPQWVPQVSLAVGFVLFVAALLRDIFRLHPPRAAAAQWLVLIAAVALAAILSMSGRQDLRIPGTRFDWGTITICATIVLGMLAWSGVASLAAATVALLGALAVCFISRAAARSSIWAC